MVIFIPCCGSSASSEGDSTRDSGGVVGHETGDSQGVEGNIGVESVGKGVDYENGELRQKVTTEYEEYMAKSFAEVPDISVEEIISRENYGNTNEADVEDESFLLVDCRTSREQAISVLPGAVTKNDFEANMQKFAGRTVVVYCTIGYRSGLYTHDLLARKIHAVNLKGGVLAWAIAGGVFIDPSTGRETKRVHVYGKQWDLLPSNYEAVY